MSTETAAQQQERILVLEAEVQQLRERISVLPTIVISAVLNSSNLDEVTIDFDNNPHLPPAVTTFDDSGRATYRKGSKT